MELILYKVRNCISDAHQALRQGTYISDANKLINFLADSSKNPQSFAKFLNERIQKPFLQYIDIKKLLDALRSSSNEKVNLFRCLFDERSKYVGSIKVDSEEFDKISTLSKRIKVELIPDESLSAAKIKLMNLNGLVEDLDSYAKLGNNAKA